MENTTREYLDTQFGTINGRLGKVEDKLTELDDSLNKTTDEAKPSIRQQVTILRKDLAQFQGIMGKVFTLLGATPITVLLGYAALHIFGQGGQK